jgi:hypothetical protein
VAEAEEITALAELSGSSARRSTASEPARRSSTRLTPGWRSRTGFRPPSPTRSHPTA